MRGGSLGCGSVCLARAGQLGAHFWGKRERRQKPDSHLPLLLHPPTELNKKQIHKIEGVSASPEPWTVQGGRGSAGGPGRGLYLSSPPWALPNTIGIGGFEQETKLLCN